MCAGFSQCSRGEAGHQGAHEELAKGAKVNSSYYK